MKRGRRLLFQVALLPFMFIVASVDDQMFQVIVSAAVLVSWPISIGVALLLVWLSRQAPEIETLVETADNAVTLAIMSTALALASILVVARVVGIVEVSGRSILVLLCYAIILVGAPSVSWLRTTRDVWFPRIRRG